jgi:hypothetical protein
LRLQFDPNHGFQLDAEAAVTDLFDGQPQGTPEYSVNQPGLDGGLRLERHASGFWLGQVKTAGSAAALL